MHRTSLTSLAFVVASLCALPPGGLAEEPVQDTRHSAAGDDAIRDTAISLNYCRASFHRIRKYPVAPVLAEEQQKILNNLNLRGIEDPEVIQLYTSVLDEIHQVQLIERQRQLHHGTYQMSMQRKVAWDVLALGTDLATGNLGNAVRQGASSWWDYRGMEYHRDAELLKIDKERIQGVTKKSADFLTTFWKLSREKNIPDRWLVRGDDLDALETACIQRDPEVRLRILGRMKPYMQAYPPYWYYVGRTQQELGDLVSAAGTFRQLVDIGKGHFRKDDMLATSLVNLATIEENFGEQSAVATATKALEYSTDVWEANLIAARIFQRHDRVTDAEDAILRNLDVGLETGQSRVFLASLYCHADEKQKLARFLETPDVVAGLPAPVLLRCAACLGAGNTPQRVLDAVLASLEVEPRLQYGPDELLVRMSPSWQLHLAHIDVSLHGRRLQPLPLENVAGTHQLRFKDRIELGTPMAAETADIEVGVRLTYPDRTVVQVAMRPSRERREAGALIDLLPSWSAQPRSEVEGRLQIAGITVDQTPIFLSRVATQPHRPAQRFLPTSQGK